MVQGEKTVPAEGQPTRRPGEGPSTAQTVCSRGPGWGEGAGHPRASEPTEGFRFYLRTGEGTTGCLSWENRLLSVV